MRKLGIIVVTTVSLWLAAPSAAVVIGGGGSCATGYVLRCNAFGHCYCSYASS